MGDSEWILKKNNQAFHLPATRDDLAPLLLFVGDPQRVNLIDKHFDTQEYKAQYREFAVSTGIIGNVRLSVIGTGIGTPNIDIVMNELEALFNLGEKQKTTFIIVRLGTSGSLQNDIPVGSLLLSQRAIGMDGLMNAYGFSSHREILPKIESLMQDSSIELPLYETHANSLLINHFGKLINHKGNTLTANGFYAPQGRNINAQSTLGRFFDELKEMGNAGPISNLEMETAAIYGFAELFGHKALSINAILANRFTQEFSDNAEKVVEEMIKLVLEEVEYLGAL